MGVWAQLRSYSGSVVCAGIGGSLMSFLSSTKGYISCGQAGVQNETKVLSGHWEYSVIIVAA